MWKGGGGGHAATDTLWLSLWWLQLFSKLRRSRHIPPGYEEGFERARMTFRHQRVYCHDRKVSFRSRACAYTCPEGTGTQRSLCSRSLPGFARQAAVPMTPLPVGATAEATRFLGPELPAHVAEAIATGDIHPVSLQPFKVVALSPATASRMAGCMNAFAQRRQAQHASGGRRQRSRGPLRHSPIAVGGGDGGGGGSGPRRTGHVTPQASITQFMAAKPKAGAARRVATATPSVRHNAGGVRARKRVRSGMRRQGNEPGECGCLAFCSRCAAAAIASPTTAAIHTSCLCACEGAQSWRAHTLRRQAKARPVPHLW